MNRDWWVPIVQWSLWGIVMVLVMGWLARSRLRARPASQTRTLAHPISTLIVGVVCSGFFFAIAVISNVYANASTSIWTTLVFIGFGLMGVPMVADYFFARHHVSDEGIEFGRMTGRRGSFAWTAVQRVSYAPAMKWFRIETDTGEVIRISVMLMGLPIFASTLLANVSVERIAVPARDVLKQTAEGNPPSVWQ